MNQSKIDIIKKGKPFLPLDIVAIALAILLAVALVISSCVTREQGGSIVIKNLRSGENTTHSLLKDDVIEVDYNGGHIKVVIKGGKAYVSEADCPDKACKSFGKISYKGEVILCAYYGVSVRVEGLSEYGDTY